MKRLVAAWCFIIFLQNFSKVSNDDETAEQKTSGKKVLVKAILAIVNTEANKKLPPRRICIASSEPPLLWAEQRFFEINFPFLLFPPAL